MKDIIMECSYYIVGLVCMVCVGEWTFHWTVRDWKRFLAAAIVYGIAIYTQFIPVNPIIPMFMLLTIGEFLAWGLLCRGRVRDKLLGMLGVYYGVSFVEIIIGEFWDLSIGALLLIELKQPFSILVTMVVMTIVTRMKWYGMLMLFFRSLSKKKAILILGIIIGANKLVTFSLAVQRILDNRAIVMIFRTLVVIELSAVAAIVIWMVVESYQKKYYQEQSNLKDEVIRTQQDYYRTIYEKDQEMRSFRHDIASHLGMLRILLVQEDIEKAKEQLNGLEKEFQQASFSQVQVGDGVLDAILSMMKQRANEKGIPLVVKGRIHKQSANEVYELCTIFSNAISNALEACEAMEQKGPVSLKLIEHNETVCVTIENPGTEEMYQAITEERSKKVDSENHGYGIKNIRRSVERLQGSMEYHYADGKIMLEILV